MQTRSYYASNVSDFLLVPSDQILGKLSTRIGMEFSGDESLQIRSWKTQIEILKATFATFGDRASGWGILIELPLLRLGRRIDTVLLINDHIACIEFKNGGKSYLTADIDQAINYALCLRDFHDASHNRKIVPILCSEHAPENNGDLVIQYTEDVAHCLKTNSETLVDAIGKAANEATGEQLDWRAYDAATYNPTPDIVTAAKHIYAGHKVRDIGRADANADSLEAASQHLRQIARQAREKKEHAICFVTGEPGAGKTLLGLDLVFSGNAGQVAGEPAVLLSGNRPLVFVLQEAIALDARNRLGIKAKEAQRRSQQALQTLLGYLKDHVDKNSSPPENVIVFDEAQRAWDAETGLKLMDRPNSEPELFLEIMDRLPWACLVCLVGPGQEINRGEGGLGLWGEALTKLADKWTIHASEAALNGSNGISGLLDHVANDTLTIIGSSDLHLRTNLRAFRNAHHGQWVKALLVGDIDLAVSVSSKMERAPAVITRNLETMKDWLKERRRGGHRVGLLASSGAVRLVADGIPTSPRSNELKDVVHWFIKPSGDYRSSNTIETPLSEFVCQGLEIDYAGLCWGNDLIWKNENTLPESGEWVPRKMRAPKWSVSRKTEEKQYRINAYRVLLTRSRAGMIIYVPKGDEDDPTRLPADFDSVYDTLIAAGCYKV